MERKLPTFEIEGTTFEVDVIKEELREIDNPVNIISIRNEISDRVDHYWFLYDTLEKNLPGPWSDKSNIVEIRMPLMVELDPEGMAARFNRSIEQVKSETDFSLLVDLQQVIERLEGRLPVIDICGHDFVVDLRLGELRPKDHFETSITLSNLDTDRDGDNYEAFYHPPSLEVVSLDHTITELPRDVVVISIPSELNLDCIGFLKDKEGGVLASGLLGQYPMTLTKAELMQKMKSETNLRQFLRDFPVMMKRSAKVTQLSETPLVGIIANNKKRQANNGQQKPNRGMGI